jgi:hypothetical protein
MNLKDSGKLLKLISFLCLCFLIGLGCKKRTFGENSTKLKSVEFLGSAGQELFLSKEGEKLSVAFSCGGSGLVLSKQEVVDELKAQLGYSDALASYNDASSALVKIESQNLGANGQSTMQDIKTRIREDLEAHGKQLSFMDSALEEIEVIFIKASLRSCFKESKSVLETEHQFARLEVYSSLTSILHKKGIPHEFKPVPVGKKEKESDEFMLPPAIGRQDFDDEFYTVFSLLTTWFAHIQLEFEPKLSLKLGPVFYQDGKRLRDELPKENKLLCVLQKATHGDADTYKPRLEGISGLIEELSFDNVYFAKANLSHFVVFTQDKSVRYQPYSTIMLNCGYRLDLRVLDLARAVGVYTLKSDTGELKSWKIDPSNNKNKTTKYAELISVFPSEVKLKLFKKSD